MNKTSVFTLVDTVRWVTFPVKNWKKAPSVSDFANLIIWCNSNMTNMGAHEKRSDLAVWTLELVELVFFKIYCKQQQQEQTITSMQSVCEQNDLNETFWLIMDFSLRQGRSPLTNMWELKQRRRQTQWERKKRNRFRFTKQQLCRCITLFCTFFFCRHCTTTTWKCLFSRFVEDVNTRKDCLSPFLNFDSFFQNSAPEKNCQHLRTNWKRWNKKQHDFTFL